jgi:NitT/TauT family transport system substrate-binding protein
MRRRGFGLAVLGLPMLARPGRAAPVVRISKQYGLGYLSMMVMERQGLVEKHATRLGVPGLQVEWSTLGGPAAQIDALLAGQADFIGPGVPTLATLWDKTAGTPQEVRALCALQSMPFVMMTRNPAIHTVADLTPRDKIALPGVKLTGHALSLEIAAAKQWGFEHFDRLDPLTVTLAHPDAMAALLGGMSEIDCHLASSPFYYYERKVPGIREVMKSYDVVGERHTNGLVLATKRFHDANPALCAAMFAALEEANAFIKAEPGKAAAIYLAMTGDKQVDLLTFTEWVRDPDVDYTTTPKAMTFVSFMHRVGRIRRQPASWQDLFFSEAHGLAGS